ncbi:MAG: Arc family DNA-binding protein [Veillonellaceae bacterium]|nr:Arc family DNA-binding protein [Veillonellaceae bacterium]
MPNELRRFTFRLPLPLYDQINAIATGNRRSLNSEIIIAIENYIKAHQSDDLTPQEPANE